MQEGTATEVPGRGKDRILREYTACCCTHGVFTNDGYCRPLPQEVLDYYFEDCVWRVLGGALAYAAGYDA